MRTTRKEPAAALAACLLFSSPAVLASDDEGYRQEPIGVGVGALVGAVAGGPPGLVAGAAIGALTGRYLGTAEALETSRERLANSRQRLAKARARNEQRQKTLRLTRARVAELERAVAEQSVKAAAYRKGIRAQRQRESEALQALARGLALSVPFRTDSAALEPRYRQRLARVAVALGSVSEWQVHLAGHADRRGTDAHNRALARRRVDAVRARLVQAGLPAERIRTAVHGEQQAEPDAGREGWFFDRRVVIRFRTGREQAL